MNDDSWLGGAEQQWTDVNIFWILIKVRVLTEIVTKRYEGHVSALVTDTRRVAHEYEPLWLLARCSVPRRIYRHSLLHHLLLMKREKEGEREGERAIDWTEGS